jgi:hypothetical protein
MCQWNIFMVNALCQISLFDTLATIAEAGASVYVRHDQAREVLVKWLDIDQLSRPDEEIVNVEWAGSRDDWGDSGTITLRTTSNRPYVAFIETL